MDGISESLKRHSTLLICPEGTSFGVIDMLDYTYGGSQLNSITDAGTRAGFDIGAGGSYMYDGAGNVMDLGPKDATFSYNALNLPYQATYATNNSTIKWDYSPRGFKVKYEGMHNTREYIPGIEYIEGDPHIYHPCGRVYKDSTGQWLFEYTLTDHLGNARVVFADTSGDGFLDPETEVLREAHYYPFGMEQQGPWNVNVDSLHTRLYNGKEFNFDSLDVDGDGNKELALGWYDYGARFYDPAMGRFTGTDPAADLRSWVSPYNYVQNNPINRIDPTGALDDPIHDSKTGEFLGHYNDSDFDGEIMLMDASTYQMITGGEDVVLSPEYAEQFGTYLQDYIGSNYKSDPAGGKELVSHVMTSLLTEASNAGIIDLDVSSLSQGKVNIQDAYGRIASSGPGYDGKWEVTGYVNTFSQNEEFTTDGTRSLWFLNNAGDAINILGVHEPLHQKYPGNHNHPIIDPLVLNPKSNPAINLASPQYIQHVQRRIARNKK